MEEGVGSVGFVSWDVFKEVKCNVCEVGFFGMRSRSEV